jgi:hypothetical protein
MKKIAALLSLVMLLTAAVGLSVFPPVSFEQQEKNRIQWMAIPEFERDQLRQQWADLSSGPVDAQLMVMRRLATLERLRARPSNGGGGTRSPEDVERTLDGMANRLRRLLDVDPASSDVETAQRLRASTKRRIDAFLDNLVLAERLTPAEREALGQASWDEFVKLALEMQKAQEIYLYSESSTRGEGNVLEALAPLDVIDEMLEIRRLRGFLGRAGVVLGLSPEEQLLLAEVPNDEFFRIAKRLMEPKAREYMSTRLDMDEEQIHWVLSRPYREVERSLNRLGRSKR